MKPILYKIAFIFATILVYTSVNGQVITGVKPNGKNGSREIQETSIALVPDVSGINVAGLSPKTKKSVTEFSSGFNNNQQRNRILMDGVELHSLGKSDISSEVRADLQLLKQSHEQNDWNQKAQHYRQAFAELKTMDPDSFSISKAVLIVENAFFDGNMRIDRYIERLKNYGEAVRQTLKKEGLDPNDDLALNYGIQKLYQQPVTYYDRKVKKTITLPPFKYDFKDYQGEESYFQVFVTKMMTMQSGQCHSMPLFYLMVAEQLGAKAWLSLAPQHSFIQFQDRNGALLNFESTNGHLVSNGWMLRSGFITANAIKEKTYLDTLSQRQLYAQCMADLLLGYMSKFGYDGYARNIHNYITALDHKNMTALLIEANLKTKTALHEINSAGHPNEKELPKFPKAYQAYLAMNNVYAKVDATGYQDMPVEAYKNWLKSISQELKKQENRELRAKMQRDMRNLQKPKVTITDRTRR